MRGDKCACGTYLDDDGRCVNADMEHRLAPPPPPPAPEGWAIPEIRRGPGAFRRFLDAMRFGGRR